MIDRINYFLGDSYSHEIFPFLCQLFPQKKFVPIKDAFDLRGSETEPLICIPTLGEELSNFFKCIPEWHKYWLLLDHNHFGFQDYKKIYDLKKPEIIFSPQKFVTGIKFITIPSLHYLMMKERVVFAENINRQDLFFCSQPLKEDRPDIGFDQFDLLEIVLKEAKQKGVRVYYKPHPRESGFVPKSCSESMVFKDKIEVALGSFTNWYGFNSMPLFTAQSLGHKVKFLKI
jgi:hypothetical protein